MSKSNQPTSSSNQSSKQDKPFSFWNIFNSKQKSCEIKNCNENCLSTGNVNNGTSGSGNDCFCEHNCNESMKLMSILKENLDESNSITKRVQNVREFNEILEKSHVCYSNFKYIIFKTIDVFGLKASNDELDDLINESNNKITLPNDDHYQLKINILRMYAKLIKQHHDTMQDEVSKILFVVLDRSIPYQKSVNLDDKSNNRMKHELNEVGLDLLDALSNQGKNVGPFRSEIDIFMMNWFDIYFENSRPELTCKYFTLLTNLIRFNASAFVDTISQFVEKSSQFFLIHYETGHVNREILLCLELYDIIFRYSILPSDVLSPFLTTLSIAVCYENLNELAWKMLRNLMKTDLTYTVLLNLTKFIEDDCDQLSNEQVLITCGSICFLARSLWNYETKLDKIKHQPSSILPALSRLLNKENLTISTHIAIAIKQLLNTQAKRLENSTNGVNSILNLNDDYGLILIYWDHIWPILHQLTDLATKNVNLKENNQRNNLISKNDHDQLIGELDVIVTIIEQLFLTGNKQISCDEKSFNFICVYTSLQMRVSGFDNQYPRFLVDRINILIDKYEQIINSNCENWIQSLTKMMEQCFKNNVDTESRIKTLQTIQKRLRMNTEKDEELIIDKIVIPYLKDVEQEIDYKVRDHILRFLIGFLKETTNNLLFSKVLEIIGRVLKKTLNRSRNNSDTSNDISLEEDPNVLIVRGLMEIFEDRIYEKNFQPSLEIYKLLSSYVCSHYCEGNNFEKISISMRLKILYFMFKIKPNYEGFIGLAKDDCKQQPMKYSKYLRCRKANQMPKSPSIGSTSSQVLTSFNLTNPPMISNQFSYDDMFNYINLCLSKERDWNILSIVLENLPSLSNPHIIYSTSYDQLIRIICENCLTLVKEFSNFNETTNKYINMPKNAKSADLQNYVFSVLTALVPYRDLIKPDVQTLIVGEIRKGLCSKQSMQQCIIILTIFTTEFQDAISKDLSRILTTLSKKTASAQLAIPKLEFLSTLNLWPNLYSTFTNNEFLSIFAIILPYTNPMKFDDFIVALAYRVSTMWYLSSRYQFRKTITDYIIKQLPENIKYSHKQAKENAYTEEYRKRSSSLNTENDLNKKPSGDSAVSTSSRITNFNSNTSNGNLHNSPSLPSPVLAHQNAGIFNFSSNLEKPNNTIIPISPNPKQQLLSNTTSSATTQQQQQQQQLLNSQQSQELLHGEYVESFVDLMSRNVVYSCSTLPNQDPIGKFLLENGLSETWVYGNKLITITTSSCSGRAVKGDLCESCFNKLNAFEEDKQSTGNNTTTANNMKQNSINDDDVFNEPTQMNNSNVQELSKFNDKDFLLSRRRHQSAFQPTTNNSVNRKQTSFTSRDDSHIENNTHMYNSCRSWAAGWAEVLIRTPTGNTSWIVKLQNSLFSNFQSNEMNDLLLNHLINNSDQKPQSNSEQTTVSITTNQSSVSLNQQHLNQNRLHQISEQPYLATSTTNLSHQSALRARSNTISTSSDMSIKRNELRLSNSLRTNENDLKFKNKMQPSFVFLQFFHQGTFGNHYPTRESPVLLPKSSLFETTLRVFDRITPSETYKVGLVYVGKGQSKDRQQILSNEYGSERYMKFVKRIGTLIRLDEIDSQKVFIGGLSQDGTDGDFACIHHENLTQAVFHVSTFMPNKENDPKCNDKMRHIGNNHVCIVYNDSQEEFDFSIIKGQWLKVCIIVTPFTHGQNFIHVQTIPELENQIIYKRQYQVVVSDQNVPHFVRQLSISASLMSLVLQCKEQNFSTSPFLSNWVNRLRKIKDIKSRVKRHLDMTDSSSIKHKPNNANSTEDVCSTAINELDNFTENFTNYI